MSTIHSSSVALGVRAELIAGNAKLSTVLSTATSNVGRNSTTSPSHSRRPARGGAAERDEVGADTERTDIDLSFGTGTVLHCTVQPVQLLPDMRVGCAERLRRPS